MLVITLSGHAVRWIDGRIQVEVVDAPGEVHRFRDKAAAVDADVPLGAHSPYPVPVEIPCRPVRQVLGPDKHERLNDVHLVPWTAAGRGLCVRREQLSWAAPAVYSDLSVAARQAAALVTFRRWRVAVGLRCPELETWVEDHLWQFMTVVPSTFDAWYDSREIGPGVGGQLEPETMRQVAAVSGARQDDVEVAVAALARITLDGLFSGIESGASLRELETVGAFTTRYGVPLAPADLFIDDLWIDHDWGSPDETVVARWRGTP